MNQPQSSTTMVQIPLTLEQLAFGIKQLPEDDLETLEVLLDEEFTEEVLKRGATAWDEHRQGKTLTLDQVKKELNV